MLSMARQWTFSQLVYVLNKFQKMLDTEPQVRERRFGNFRIVEHLIHDGPPRNVQVALNYLDETFKDEVDIEELDEPSRAVLSELWNRWGIVTRRYLGPARALAVFDHAIDVSTDDTRQAILYNRGFARLLVAFTDIDINDIGRKATPAHAMQLLNQSVTDLTEAVHLATDDDAALAQLALAHLVLAARGRRLSFRERVRHVDTAKATYEACLNVIPLINESERPTVEGNLAIARSVHALLATVPAWKRALNLVGDLPLIDVRATNATR